MCSVHLMRCHKTIQAFIILDLLNVIKLFHILGPAVCFNNSTLSDARLFPCRRCSPLTQADWWEQGAVSCSRTHVSEAALWENSETGTIDYAWRQVTCLVIHNETEIKLLSTPQLRPSLKLEFFSCELWYESKMMKPQTDSHSGQMFWHIAVLRGKKKVSDALRILTISNILMKYMFCFFGLEAVRHQRDTDGLCLLLTRKRTTKHMLVITLMKSIWVDVSASSF